MRCLKHALPQRCLKHALFAALFNVDANLRCACAETTVLANGLKEEKFIVVAVHPGFVITDMGKEAASLASSNQTSGYGPTMTATESVQSMLTVFQDLTFASSGSYMQWDGKRMAW